MPTILVHGSAGRFGSYSKWDTEHGNVIVPNGLQPPIGATLVIPVEFHTALNVTLTLGFTSMVGYPPDPAGTPGSEDASFLIYVNPIVDTPIPAQYILPQLTVDPANASLDVGPCVGGIYTGHYDLDITALMANSPTHVIIMLYRYEDEGDPLVQVPWIHTVTCSAEIVVP